MSLHGKTSDNGEDQRLFFMQLMYCFKREKERKAVKSSLSQKNRKKGRQLQTREARRSVLSKVG